MNDTVPGFRSPPKLLVELSVWQQMMAFVLACPVEVNGFGYVSQVDTNIYRLDEVFILDQLATAASVEVTAEALARHLFEMSQQNIDPSRMRFQWHSHVNMEAYFSGTDLDNIDNYASDWMMSLVANKAGNFQARLDVYRPFRVWWPLDVQVVHVPDELQLQRARGEIRDKVRVQGALLKRHVQPDHDATTHVAGKTLHNGRP